MWHVSQPLDVVRIRTDTLFAVTIVLGKPELGNLLRPTERGLAIVIWTFEVASVGGLNRHAGQRRFEVVVVAFAVVPVAAGPELLVGVLGSEVPA